jgi:adenylate cyclase
MHSPVRLGRLTADAKEALAAGDLLRVCDLALDARPAGQDAIVPLGAEGTNLAKLHVLAQARMGNSSRAADLYERYRLAEVDDLDAQALRARLAKDEAFASDPVDFSTVREAARAYLDVYERYRDPYPGINAASLALIAGDKSAARKIAGRLLRTERLEKPRGYYDTVTVAEAMLVLERTDECAALVRRACALDDADIGSRSTTARQFALIGAALGLPQAELDALLEPLRPPAVLAFSGSAAACRELGEDALAAAVDALIADNRVGIGYGALARGAEIVIAERLLASGGELNVVLPVLDKDFIAHFVGVESSWYSRFVACLERAATVTLAADSSYVGDVQQLRFGGAVAAGLASLRAMQLGTTGLRLVAWDAAPRVAEIGRLATIGELPDYAAEASGPLPDPRGPHVRLCAGGKPAPERALKAILFADFPGFSKLAEHRLPAFWEEVMRRIATVLDRHGNAVAFRNTWGDAIYAVVDTAREAALIALEIVDALAEVNSAALGLDRNAGMRIGAHLGPVYAGADLVTGARNYFGTQVSRAARIEPITPPGAVYVTEQFAAVLALEEPDNLICTYVGRLELPKDHGPQRMYRLSRPSRLPASLQSRSKRRGKGKA